MIHNLNVKVNANIKLNVNMNDNIGNKYEKISLNGTGIDDKYKNVILNMKVKVNAIVNVKLNLKVIGNLYTKYCQRGAIFKAKRLMQYHQRFP